MKLARQSFLKSTTSTAGLGMPAGWVTPRAAAQMNEAHIQLVRHVTCLIRYAGWRGPAHRGATDRAKGNEPRRECRNAHSVSIPLTRLSTVRAAAR